MTHTNPEPIQAAMKRTIANLTACPEATRLRMTWYATVERIAQEPTAEQIEMRNAQQDYREALAALRAHIATCKVCGAA